MVGGFPTGEDTTVRTVEADKGRTIKSVWRLHDGALVESQLLFDFVTKYFC